MAKKVEKKEEEKKKPADEFWGDNEKENDFWGDDEDGSEDIEPDD
jgi:hypothetical protein